MPYEYEVERQQIFSDDGQRRFLTVRDRVQRLLREAGAVRMQEAISGVGGDSWTQLAYVDRLVELGEIREVTGKDVAGQHRVFVRAGG